MSVCLILFDGCFMKWPNALSLHWHIIWDIFTHYFESEGKDVAPQYVPHLLSRSYKRRSTKLHASAGLLTICKSMEWSLSVGYTTKFLRQGTHYGNATQAEIFRSVLMAWVRMYIHTIHITPTNYWVMRKCCVNAVVTHASWVILDV